MDCRDRPGNDVLRFGAILLSKRHHPRARALYASEHSSALAKKTRGGRSAATAHRAFSLPLLREAGASQRSGAAALRCGPYFRGREPCSCRAACASRDTGGTRLGSGLKPRCGRNLSAAAQSPSSRERQRVFHARGRYLPTSRCRVCETRQRAPNLSPHQ